MSKFSEAELDTAYNRMIELLEPLAFDTLKLELTDHGTRMVFTIELAADDIQVALTDADEPTLLAAAAAIMGRAEILSSAVHGNTTLH